MAGVRQTKRNDGTRHVKWRYWYLDLDGKRRWGTGTQNKAQTLRFARKLEEEHKEIRLGLRPKPHKNANRSFEEVKEDYLSWGRKHGGKSGHPWSPSHIRNKIRHLNWWQEKLNLQTVGDLYNGLSAVEKIIAQLEMARTAKTAANYAETIKSFCVWCRKRGLLKENPLQDLAPLPAAPETQRRALTPEEIRRLLNACNPKKRLLYSVALTTGLRANELRSITTRHLDVKNGGIILDERWTKNREPGFQPLPQTLMNELARTAQPQWSDQPLLDVTTQPAKFLDSDLKRAGIPKWTDEGKIDFHALRTTFTTLVIESGANQKEAMELARHATPLLTFNTYARARQPRLKEITEKVGVEIGACANGVQQDNEDETKEGEKPLNNNTYKEIKVAERAGFEPAVRLDRTTAFEAAAFNHSATSPVSGKRIVSKGGGSVLPGDRGSGRCQAIGLSPMRRARRRYQVSFRRWIS